MNKENSRNNQILVLRWLKVNERNKSYLAKKIGYNPGMMTRFFKGQSVSPEFLIALKEYTGLPLQIELDNYKLVRQE